LESFKSNIRDREFEGENTINEEIEKITDVNPVSKEINLEGVHKY